MNEWLTTLIGLRQLQIKVSSAANWCIAMVLQLVLLKILDFIGCTSTLLVVFLVQYVVFRRKKSRPRTA